jgi:hypothetical protein
VAHCHASTLTQHVVNVNQSEWCGVSLHVRTIWPDGRTTLSRTARGTLVLWLNHR